METKNAGTRVLAAPMPMMMMMMIVMLLLLPLALGKKDCRNSERVLVIGTHPDDEILCCSGVISRALSHGMCVNVAILTNGEYWAASKERGLERQVESLNALSKLGLKDPEDVIFLGYPDNYLSAIYKSYRDKGAALLTNKNVDSTFGGYGRGNADYHYTKFGVHGPYNYDTLLKDVTSILSDFDPNYLFVTATSIDSHGDHKVTHEVTMDALKQASVPSLQAIYSTTVWNGNNTWPNSMDPFSNVDEIPPPIGFTKTPVRINVPLEMRTTKWESNPKYLAMAEHITQNGVQCSFLLRFLHRDEMFWTKSPTEDKRVPIADAGSDVEACQGEVVTLDGTRSVLDPSDAEIKWVQTKGPSVAIEGDTTLTPHFAVPKLQNQEGSGADLEFELTVTSYGGVKAFPSSVVVTLLPYNYKKYGENVARMAHVKASSERRYYRQSAEAAIDGAVDGLIRYHEWVTEGEREGAWIKLTWDRPIRAAKVVLYDRISCKNQVTAGVLGFSDGSKITVGRLDNKGSPNVFEFEPKTVTEMYFNVTQVSYSTEEAGLAEIMVYELESEPGCPKEEPIDTNDQETNTNKPAKDDNKDKGKQDNTAPPKKEKEEEKEIKTKEGKPAAEQKEQTNNRAQEKESQKEVPGSGFLIALFVVAALVALFVVLLKKNTVAPRNSNPIVRAVFYRPHTHEF